MRELLQAIEPKNQYNILTFATHERYQSDMDKISANFFMYRKPPHIKEWNNQFANLPKNHFILPIEHLGESFGYDYILSQNKFGQTQLAMHIANDLKIPLITLEHTLPLKHWSKEQFQNIKKLKGDINLYISKFSASMWEEEQPVIIPHCVNTDLFKPNIDFENRDNVILTVANDYIGRSDVLGYDIYKVVTENLPRKPVGDTPGLSKAAKDTQELCNYYTNSRIFLNTSTWSPIPKSLLEAMSSGCAVVSTNNCAIPDYIEHGVNGLLANHPEEMRKYLESLISDKDFAEFLGNNARQTIIQKCDKNNFTNFWNNLFNHIRQKELEIEN